MMLANDSLWLFTGHTKSRNCDDSVFSMTGYLLIVYVQLPNILVFTVMLSNSHVSPCSILRWCSVNFVLLPLGVRIISCFSIPLGYAIGYPGD